MNKLLAKRSVWNRPVVVKWMILDTPQQNASVEVGFSNLSLDVVGCECAKGVAEAADAGGFEQLRVWKDGSNEDQLRFEGQVWAYFGVNPPFA